MVVQFDQRRGSEKKNAVTRQADPISAEGPFARFRATGKIRCVESSKDSTELPKIAVSVVRCATRQITSTLSFHTGSGRGRERNELEKEFGI